MKQRHDSPPVHHHHPPAPTYPAEHRQEGLQQADPRCGGCRTHRQAPPPSTPIPRALCGPRQPCRFERPAAEEMRTRPEQQKPSPFPSSRDSINASTTRLRTAVISHICRDRPHTRRRRGLCLPNRYCDAWRAHIFHHLISFAVFSRPILVSRTDTGGK